MIRFFPMVINRKHSKYANKRSYREDTYAAEETMYQLLNCRPKNSYTSQYLLKDRKITLTQKGIWFCHFIRTMYQDMSTIKKMILSNDVNHD